MAPSDIVSVSLKSTSFSQLENSRKCIRPTCTSLFVIRWYASVRSHLRLLLSNFVNPHFSIRSSYVSVNHVGKKLQKMSKKMQKILGHCSGASILEVGSRDSRYWTGRVVGVANGSWALS